MSGGTPRGKSSSPASSSSGGEAEVTWIELIDAPGPLVANFLWIVVGWQAHCIWVEVVDEGKEDRGRRSPA
jgi:hypothetical protein